ncbi:DUF2812 domain-containing protein [Enterococcus casseliflavus]|uniref:DUF2812 domain-containing protein n=1 Tax=Enterococcus casseliflavus TaxID=37734 RepID=UPI003D11E0DC
MGINKKYLLSLGVAYYPEKEMVRLQKQASLGWHFVKMNRLGFLKFIKGDPETTKYAVDFFEGEPSEIVDYLAMYQAGGWTYISNYKDRYFYFKASPDTPAIFSDQESYQERIDNETRYLMKKSILLSVISLVILAAIYFLIRYFNIRTNPFWSFGLGLITGLVFIPIGVGLTTILMKFLYKNRASYYNKPEKLAKRQRVIRDTVILMFVGAIIGAVIGFFFSDIFY